MRHRLKLFERIVPGGGRSEYRKEKDCVGYIEKNVSFCSVFDFEFDEFKTNHPGKQIAVIYGNCHTTAIRIALEHYLPFADRYAIYPIKAVQEVIDAAYFKQKVFFECDVFIHQSIRLNNRYGSDFASENIVKQLKPSCRVIAIPNLYHLPMCFFPQFVEGREWVSRNGSTMFCDKILDVAFSKGLSVERTKQLYCSDYFDKDFLVGLFNSFISKVKSREEEWDIKVSDFIIENYKNHRLFYDPNHPTPFLIAYYIRELMTLMDIAVDVDEIYLLSNLCKLNGHELFIIPCVLKSFNMTFTSHNIREDMKGVFDNLDLDTYIKYYWLYEWQNKNLVFAKRIKSYIDFTRFRVMLKLLKKP